MLICNENFSPILKEYVYNEDWEAENVIQLHFRIINVKRI